MMIFRQLFDPQSSTYTYLLADPASREALLIDPVFEQVRRDAALVDEEALAGALASGTIRAAAIRSPPACRAPAPTPWPPPWPRRWSARWAPLPG